MKNRTCPRTLPAALADQFGESQPGNLRNQEPDPKAGAKPEDHVGLEPECRLELKTGRQADYQPDDHGGAQVGAIGAPRCAAPHCPMPRSRITCLISPLP